MLKWLTELIYPPRCPGCGAAVEQHGQWCPQCLAAVWHPRRINRTRAVPHIDGCYCLADYRGTMRNILHRIKYDKALRYAASCRYVLDRFPWPERLAHIDYVVPVPLSPEKQAQRGFNQAELIFRPWAEQHWLWYDALQRVRPTTAQWQLRRQDRAENVNDVMELRPAGSDDIYTTGATMEACAKVLKHKKAASVTGLVIASGAL
jgi:ComF family protein